MLRFFFVHVNKVCGLKLIKVTSLHSATFLLLGEQGAMGVIKFGRVEHVLVIMNTARYQNVLLI